MNNDEKNIEIVSGNGDDLNISPVYDNLDIAKPSEDTNTTVSYTHLTLPTNREV